MLENDIFEQWLRDEADRVLAKLKANEPITQDDKLIIVLHSQANHFHHLDVELRRNMRDLDIKLTTEVNALGVDMDKRFEQVDRRFEQVDKRLDQVFNQLEKRFDMLSQRIDRLMVLIVTIGIATVPAMKLLPAL
uniref:t-SNARE coiled-coil homology domain-containing protein n=1 Tax=Candidatus Kentrum eta TaxID=2126337 RepID=A0A450UFL0_9GAMM|nr:MAG: hypothetical protein BECKH772A_GA0070896_100134 [Candidatus Kentron sp. H]VFJ91242.1 MAG: hypothetical protein BECKH772B_GA0070898_1001522 [Candidatus Kentron sp. H]VFJ97677.1 MAG: hypothetical protein BECKH772C_GA0070978_100153 [Candidatus Kentron sp. H]